MSMLLQTALAAETRLAEGLALKLRCTVKNGGAKDGFDMNVAPAWQKGYTGKGVVVSILDDGIQTNHPDLALNYEGRVIANDSLDVEVLRRADPSSKESYRMSIDQANEKLGPAVLRPVSQFAYKGEARYFN
ncbi:Furin-like protease 2 [Zootermopsis nevadensis]|uniref:Furin-like protease 2 n=1 Tax=Zootermopsis nevadensis TaxID=136037 RepID=A0A067RK72_ZOONE|nr:Furin-like protease 2 [Zootermopsis nevadensis]